MGRIFGIPIELNYSWVLVYLLLTFLLAQQFEESRLGWTAAHRWSVAMVIVVLFFLSVLVHELSHSLVAMRRGIPVQGITLFIFGGVSRLGREPEGPLTESSIAVVGPLTSVILAAIFGGIWYALGDGSSTLQVSLFLLAWTNLALAGFNILPGYPLDGGRVLRAAGCGLGRHRKPPARHQDRCPGWSGSWGLDGGRWSVSSPPCKSHRRYLDRHCRCVLVLCGHRQLQA